MQNCTRVNQGHPWGCTLKSIWYWLLSFVVVVFTSKTFLKSISQKRSMNQNEGKQWTMTLIGVIFSVSLELCAGIDQHPSDYVPLHEMIQIHIINDMDLGMVSFNVEADTTTFSLYQMAEILRILDSDHTDNSPIRNDEDWLVDEATGTFLKCDSNLEIQDILTPDPGVGNTKEITLLVVTTSDLNIAVHITSGASKEAVWAKPSTSTFAIYEYAVRAGILQNTCQFMLCHENDHNRFLSASPDPSSTRLLLEHLDPGCPLELKLEVMPIPDGQLIFWMFREMVPLQGMAFWQQAIFDHEQHGLKSQMVANCKAEMWAGKLDLKFVPASIKLLELKGCSAIVDFKDLIYVSLKELVLDFIWIFGIDWLNLRGSQLERLHLPAHFAMSADDAVTPVEILTYLRSRREIQINAIEFGDTEKIVYDTQSDAYLYSVCSADCIIM